MDLDPAVRAAAAGGRSRRRLRADRQQRDHRRGLALSVVHVRAAVPGRATAVAAGRLGPADGGRAGRDAGGHGLARGAGVERGARRARAARPRRRRVGAVAAGRVRREPRGRVGRRAALRLLPAGARGRAVPAGARRDHLGVGRVGHARADAVDGPPMARQRHLGTAGDAGSSRRRSGRRRRAEAAGARGGAARAGRGLGGGRPRGRPRPRAVAVGRRPPGGPGAPVRPEPVPERADGRRLRHHSGRRVRLAGGRPVQRHPAFRVPAGGGPRVRRLRQLRHPRRRVRRPGQPAFRRPAHGVGRAPTHPDDASRPERVRTRPPRPRWPGAGGSSTRWPP